ncbi:MAG: hypothetical protein Q9212_003965 [Teloschistes hypoglaucus]
MYFKHPAHLLILGLSTSQAFAVHHDLSSSQADLEQITNAPGPPTIQPGIPSLQPSIPTSGVPSLSIPPWHQTPSSKTSDHLPSSEYPQIPSLATTSTATSTHATSVNDPKSTSTSIAASIPYLSELITQPITPSPAVSLPTFTVAPAASSSIFQSSMAGTQSPQEVPTGQLTTPPAEGNDPKDGILTASMPSTLIYSFMLPPYPGGLDSSGIAETQTLSSSTTDKDHFPSISIYSYSLPPYTPKIPTYVATSASVAAISMTTGASGYPSANNAHTTRVFLPKGSVDPLKDIPEVATSSTVPLYSPACLGNAYGGGYVITPTVSAPNANGTAVAKIPPAYGFTYKLEPTQSPGYGAAVVIASTGGPTPTRAPLPITTTSGSRTGAAGGGIVQISETSTVTTCPCEDTPTFTTTVTEGLVTQILAPGQSAITHSNLNPTVASITTGSADMGLHQATPLNQATATSSGHSIISSLSSSIAIKDAVQNEYLVSNPGPAVTGASSGLSTVDSAGATRLPQNQYHRAAVSLSNAAIDNMSAVSPQYLGSQLNNTLMPAENGTDITAFQGDADQITASRMSALVLSMLICLLYSIF